MVWPPESIVARRVLPAAAGAEKWGRRKAILLLLGISALAMFLNVLAGVDFSQADGNFFSDVGGLIGIARSDIPACRPTCSATVPAVSSPAPMLSTTRI